MPDGLTDAEAAGFWIPHLTAWIGLVDRGHLAADEWLAVLGAAGGSGIAAVQLGRALGARVIAVVSDDGTGRLLSRARRRHRRSIHRDGPLGPALREATGGRGVDVIYDPVGGPLAEDAAAALARGGRLLAVGFASGAWPRLESARPGRREHVARRRVRRRVQPRRARRDPRNLAAFVADGRLRNAVTAVVPFDELPTALQRMADRPSSASW